MGSASPQDLSPKAVGLLDAGGHDDIGRVRGEGGVPVEDFLEVGGKLPEDPGHALPHRDVGGDRAIDAVQVQVPALEAQGDDPLVLPAVPEAEGCPLQLVLEAVHAQAAREGGVDAQGVAGLPDHLGGELGRPIGIGRPGREEAAEPV